MKTKKVTIIVSDEPVEITFRAVDLQDIKKNQTVCREHCSLYKLCEKLANPDSDFPESSFNDFCRNETSEDLFMGVILVPEITEEEAINLIGFKHV